MRIHVRALSDCHAPLPRGGRAEEGFSRSELLVVLVVSGLLTLLILPALAATGQGAASVGCLNNLRRLAQGWLLFAEDHQGFLPGNVDDGSTQGYNWVGGQAGRGASAEFNPDVVTGSSSQLGVYLGREAGSFRCPGDPRTGIYQGTGSSLRGRRVPAARSYAMNGAVGTLQDGYTRVHGPWLDGVYSHQAGQTWETFGRLDAIVDPAPAQLYVFVGEDPYSINDGLLGLSMQGGAQMRMIDYPETVHEFGGGFSFADGHAAIHRWQDARTLVVGGILGPSGMPNSPDIGWLQARTTTLIK